MRRIQFSEYNKKRKKARVDLLRLREKLNIKDSKGSKEKKQMEWAILFKMAKKNKEKMLKKIGERKYQLRSKGNSYGL